MDLRLAIIRGRRAGFDLFLEVDKDVHVVLQQFRRQADRVGRGNGTVGPHFKGELVVVGDLSKTRSFDRVVALAHG